MPQIYKRIPMPERDFNKVAEQLGELLLAINKNNFKNLNSFSLIYGEKAMVDVM